MGIAASPSLQDSDSIADVKSDDAVVRDAPSEEGIPSSRNGFQLMLAVSPTPVLSPCPVPLPLPTPVIRANKFTAALPQ